MDTLFSLSAYREHRNQAIGGVMSIKSKSSFLRGLVAGAVGMVLVYLPIQEALAQLEEIVVTSRRYEEAITDAPIAVAVMDSQYLEDQRINTIQDILELSPGASWDQFAAAQPGLSLRGLFGGTFGNASLESAVQVVYDGVPLTKAFMMTIPAYDLERVEVMRGPQGTTFGRNATIGLMHFISAKPSQEFSGDVQATVGVDGPDLFGVSGHIGGGLSDTVSGRFAFHYQDRDGAMEDVNTGAALENYENISVRGSLLFEPSDSFSALVKLEYITNDDLPQVRRGEGCTSPWLIGGNGFYTDDPAGYTDSCREWTADQDDSREWFLERDMLFLTAELVWSLNNDMAITSITGYQDGEHHTAMDAFGTPFALRDQLVDNDAEVLSTELRIDNHASDNRFRWLFGAAYTDDTELRTEQNIGMPERVAGCGRNPAFGRTCPEWNLVQRGDGDNESLGIFGELTYDFSDRWTASVGVRYTDESRTLDWVVDGWGDAGGLAGIGLANPDPGRDCNDPANRFPDPQGRGNQNPPPGVATICGTVANPVGFDAVAKQSWDNTSIRVNLQWAVTDNSNLYATYSEGYKAGGFQHDARNLEAFNLFIEPEEMENIEIGWKGSYERAIFAVTAFEMEQTNSQVGLQVAVGSGNANMVFNAASVEVTGFELEGTFAVTDNFQVGGNIGIYDAEFGPGSTTGAVFDPSGQIVPSGADISGERPNTSPEETWALWGSYVFDLSGGSSLRLRADWQHRGDQWARVANRDGLNIAGTQFINLRPDLDRYGVDVSWTSADDKLSFSVWSRNLNDEMDQLNPGPGVGYIFNLGQAGPNGGRDRTRPRGFAGRNVSGATATYRFGE
jgi:iron complex outermembrane receptor protein